MNNELTVVGRIAKRLLLFGLPFFAAIALVLVVDPYDCFGTGLKNMAGLKAQVAGPRNYALAKLGKYRQTREPCILLGDSKTGALSVSNITQLTGRQFANLAYGGGSLPEMIDTFWYAVSLTDIKEVYMGMNLVLYNEYQNGNRVTPALDVLNNPLLYLINRDVLSSTFETIYLKMCGVQNVEKEKPDRSREEFWRYQMNVSAKRFFAKYKHPEKYREQLAEIAAYCKEKNILLNFIILPGHADLQNSMREQYGLASAEAKMLEDIAVFGRVWNFDVVDDVTIQMDNFGDPFHVRGDRLREYEQVVWGDR